jgi:hypothetical protein
VRRMSDVGGWCLSRCCVVLRRLLQIAALRVRSSDFKELEIVVLRQSSRHSANITRVFREVIRSRLGYPCPTDFAMGPVLKRTDTRPRLRHADGRRIVDRLRSM